MLHDQEQTIINLLKKDDEEGLKIAVFQYYQKLFNFSLRITGDREAAEEITSDAFVYLWERRNILIIQSTLRGYLLKIVRNRSIDYHRKRLKQSDFLELTDYPEENHSALSIEYQDLNELMHKAIALLPEKCSTILRLSRFSQLSHKEIAEQLGISKKTVENQITIALKRLRVILERNGYPILLLCLTGTLLN